MTIKDLKLKARLVTFAAGMSVAGMAQSVATRSSRAAGEPAPSKGSRPPGGLDGMPPELRQRASADKRLRPRQLVGSIARHAMNGIDVGFHALAALRHQPATRIGNDTASEADTATDLESLGEKTGASSVAHAPSVAGASQKPRRDSSRPESLSLRASLAESLDRNITEILDSSAANKGLIDKYSPDTLRPAFETAFRGLRAARRLLETVATQAPSKEDFSSMSAETLVADPSAQRPGPKRFGRPVANPASTATRLAEREQALAELVGGATDNFGPATYDDPTLAKILHTMKGLPPGRQGAWASSTLSNLDRSSWELYVQSGSAADVARQTAVNRKVDVVLSAQIDRLQAMPAAGRRDFLGAFGEGLRGDAKARVRARLAAYSMAPPGDHRDSAAHAGAAEEMRRQLSEPGRPLGSAVPKRDELDFGAEKGEGSVTGSSETSTESTRFTPSTTADSDAVLGGLAATAFARGSERSTQGAAESLSTDEPSLVHGAQELDRGVMTGVMSAAVDSLQKVKVAQDAQIEAQGKLAQLLALKPDGPGHPHWPAFVASHPNWEEEVASAVGREQLATADYEAALRDHAEQLELISDIDART